VGLFEVLLTPFHELGHATAAWLLHLRVFTICIGTCGRIVWMPRILGLDVAFRSVPVGGYTLIVSRGTSWARSRYFLAVLAGPMMHVALIGFALAFLEPNRITTLTGLIAFAFIVSNVLDLGFNLWPHSFWDGTQVNANDGMLLWQILRWRQSDIENWHARFFYLEGLESRERGKPDAARKWFENGAAAYPDDPSNRVGLGQLLLDAGRPAEARETFRKVLASLDEKSPWYFYCCNYVAVAALLTRQPELMEEAVELSDRAYSAIPWSGDVEGVRGCVLVALQDYERGTTLLRAALEKEGDRPNKALFACHLAKTLTQLGRGDESDTYLQMARKLNGKCVLLEGAGVDSLREKVG
jgi:tetratricopeptide (TPR) repeat protein